VESLCGVREKPDKSLWTMSNTRGKTHSRTLWTTVDKVENSPATIIGCFNRR
jgi:hypothetical protein